MPNVSGEPAWCGLRVGRRGGGGDAAFSELCPSVVADRDGGGLGGRGGARPGICFVYGAYATIGP